jgi:hypothetical protein
MGRLDLGGGGATPLTSAFATNGEAAIATNSGDAATHPRACRRVFGSVGETSFIDGAVSVFFFDENRAVAMPDEEVSDIEDEM